MQWIELFWATGKLAEKNFAAKNLQGKKLANHKCIEKTVISQKFFQNFKSQKSSGKILKSRKYLDKNLAPENDKGENSKNPKTPQKNFAAKNSRMKKIIAQW